VQLVEATWFRPSATAAPGRTPVATQSKEKAASQTQSQGVPVDVGDTVLAAST
jgi:hypothetical protein